MNQAVWLSFKLLKKQLFRYVAILNEWRAAGREKPLSAIRLTDRLELL